MNKTIITVFALIGIFFCGAIAGGVFAVRYVNVTVQRKAAAQQLSNQQWVRITNRLDPTPEQREQIKAIVTVYMEKQQASRQIERDASAKLHNDIRAVLTPGQVEEYDKIRARHRENERLWQRWYKEQRARHGESPLVSPKRVDLKNKKEKGREKNPKPATPEK
ncbi:Spy/CpxP family protein refolding chaperone [Ereboglobus sp. PH5-10]|uniref:hypothetical protein n=1 Tax=Ereboglobus sp. PH5-10 TaxID=2940629 RepID=UPI002405C76F|nr:hypothetical protein [Ereboglobus sp. PH5-10]MDF9826764.1 Spy/CpxP family protein refolding chaperone [Ereboglobus sp. PH5-10]